MKYMIILFFLIGSVHAVSAQSNFAVTPRHLAIPPLKHNPEDSVKMVGLPLNLSAYKLPLKNTGIENPGIRYVIQNLKKDKYRDKDVAEALGTLLEYAENDSLRGMIQYLQQYMKKTGEKEHALTTLQAQIDHDSVDFYTRNAHLTTTNYFSTQNSDLKILLNFIQNDSAYMWLKDKSRDSVFIEVVSTDSNSLRIWLNNGKNEYHRFWAANGVGDSIGAWVEIIPGGNKLRIYMDDDVYQTITDKKTAKEVSIATTLPEEFYMIKGLSPGKLRRRYWTYYSEVELALSQGKLANWASGGENSLSLLTNLRYFVNYNRNKTSWENFIHFRLGFLKSGEDDLQKNDDRFEFNSKLGQKAFKHWFYTAQFNLQTQIFNTFEYPKDNPQKLIANFLSPGYFTLSLGLDYKPNDNFSLFISPIAGKWNYVRDTANVDPTRFGIEKGERTKSDAGAKIELRNKFSLLKIMDIRNEMVFFSSYYNEEQVFTANWILQIDFKINYFIRASVYTNIIYDQNYSKKLQFKENLNLGVNFRF